MEFDFNTYRHLGFTTISNALLAYYVKLNLSDAELVIILQLEAFGQKGQAFPSADQIASNTNMTSTQVSTLIQGLIEKKKLQLRQTHDDQGKITDYYDLSLLYQALSDFLKENLPVQSESGSKFKNDNDFDENDPLPKLIRQFEIEFGRLLSPIEREQVSDWLSIDHYDPKIVILALREAVLAQVYNFKYVDRILLNWQHLNLKSVTEVQTYLTHP